jgi:small subunit ribosomal protein S16
MFRIIVQDSHRSPTSGKIVTQLGHYDPHTKHISIDKEKTEKFLSNGAQPSDRVISLLKSESVKLPKWAITSPAKSKTVKNPEKRRSTAPEPAEKPEEKPEPAVAEPTEAAVEQPETPEASESTEEATEEVKDEPTEEQPPVEPQVEAEPEPEAAEAKSEEEPADTKTEDSEKPEE